MKAKLIKREDGLYFLNDENGKLIYGKLSIKNCQAIERGYDLDELAESLYLKSGPDGISDTLSFKIGFQKALEILGDKKFSEEDVILIAEYIRVASQSTPSVRTKDLFDEYQSLQQTEWEVEIEMQRVKDETKIIGAVKGVKGSGNKITIYKSVPKLDADGCLILKRI